MITLQAVRRSDNGITFGPKFGIFMYGNHKVWKPGMTTCFLHRAKCICSKYELYLKEVQKLRLILKEVQKLRLIFNNNGYSYWFINNTFKKFGEQPATKNNSQKPEKDFYLLLACRILENLHTNLQKNLLFGKNKI